MGCAWKITCRVGDAEGNVSGGPAAGAAQPPHQRVQQWVQALQLPAADAAALRPALHDACILRKS